VAVALDSLGRRLGELTVPTTKKGYEILVCWAESFGPVGCARVEGTSSYGAGLARHLRSARIGVFEVERPKRRHLRRKGKSDSKDAESAARAGNRPGKPRASQRVETAAWR
jgi:transposase